MNPDEVFYWAGCDEGFDEGFDTYEVPELVSGWWYEQDPSFNSGFGGYGQLGYGGFGGLGGYGSWGSFGGWGHGF